MGEDDTLAVNLWLEIMRGVPKEQSRYVTDEESSDLWDRLVVDIAEIEAKGGTTVPSNKPREDG